MYSPKAILSALVVGVVLVSGCGQLGSGSTDDSSLSTTAEEATSNDSAGSSELDDSEQRSEVSNDDLIALAAILNDELPTDVEECVIKRVSTDPALLGALTDNGSTTDLVDLPLNDQLAVFESAVECGNPELLGQYFTDGFAEGSGAAPPPEMTECFVTAMSGGDGALIMAGFLAVGAERRPPLAARNLVIDLLTDCVPGSYLAESITVGLASNQQLAEAVDQICVTGAYADGILARPLWESLIDNPGTEIGQLPSQTTAGLFGPLFDCVSFGQVVATEAAAEGVTISEASITCFDDEFLQQGFADLAFAGGEVPEAEITEILLTCLTPDELRQLGSG
ncbi:MAG: hypothetical protein GY724_16530 [Actinomycetia bacterium]|nr:hypothetical protein [Actinomycetes bacterium]MCP5032683.1 hypothetical protein [Actinomycetes bacterium]